MKSLVYPLNVRPRGSPDVLGGFPGACHSSGKRASGAPSFLGERNKGRFMSQMGAHNMESIVTMPFDASLVKLFERQTNFCFCEGRKKHNVRCRRTKASKLSAVQFCRRGRFDLIAMRIAEYGERISAT